MTSDELMRMIDYLCEAWRNATANHVAAQHEDNYEEQVLLNNAAQDWQRSAGRQHAAIERAVQASLAIRATVEDFMPVRPLPDGKVELRVVHTHGLRINVVLTGKEALSLGTRTIVCATVSLDRIGFKPADGMPLPIPAFVGPIVATAPVPPVVPGAPNSTPP
ncbi:hypothetical protein [Paractinoplanes globisporus]|uniref:Uncharacterized protein n=1 Tax=Paractinoplanes globisporus TaxID=113565 RepID=A0ABW6WKP7_9ACTN|nr:hypothetical protein [Actinoplanes globisporus]